MYGEVKVEERDRLKKIQYGACVITDNDSGTLHYRRQPCATLDRNQDRAVMHV